MRGGATFDASGAYRYHLWRKWDESRPPVTFVMLNPSAADAERDDPTIRRCIGFARRWGYGQLEVVNLFAFRATSPRELFAAGDPVGRENEEWLHGVARSDALVLAWGNDGARAPSEVRGHVTSESALCLGLTRLTQPRHPLYVPANAAPRPFSPAAAP
jgi:hypothetical protein